MSDPQRLRHQWLTTAEIAAEYGRTERTIQRWCSDGTLRAFGFLTYRSSDRNWYIRPA